MSDTPQFRTVLRGYEPAEVDATFRDLREQLARAREAADQAGQANTRAESCPRASASSRARRGPPGRAGRRHHADLRGAGRTASSRSSAWPRTRPPSCAPRRTPTPRSCSTT